MLQVTIQGLLNDVSRIQRVTLPYLFDTALLADKECYQSIKDSEAAVDDTAALLKYLAKDLSATLVNINDMQAAALYLGCDCVMRSDSAPVSVIESTFRRLIAKPYIRSNVINTNVTTPFQWSVVEKQIHMEVRGHVHA